MNEQSKRLEFNQTDFLVETAIWRLQKAPEYSEYGLPNGVELENLVMAEIKDILEVRGIVRGADSNE